MKQRKIAALLMALLLSLSLFAGCGTTKNNESTENVSSQGSETLEQTSEEDENAEAAEKLLNDWTDAVFDTRWCSDDGYTCKLPVLCDLYANHHYHDDAGDVYVGKQHED